MDRFSSRLSTHLIFFLLLGFGFALYITLSLQLSSLTLTHHSYFFEPLVFLPVWIGAALALSLIWALLVHIDIRFLKVERSRAESENFYLFGPLSLLLLTPLCLLHFMTQEDLRLRLICLLIFAAVSSILLKFFQMNKFVSWAKLWEKGTAWFIRLRRRKKLILLFFVSFVIYQSCTFFIVSEGFSFSGDEPYYLMTTHSLYRDQDINVANNYDNKDYYSFYPKELYPDIKLGLYGRYGKKGTRWIYPINQPGISVLMLPFYALAQSFKGRLMIFILKGSLSLWAALLGLQIFLLATDLWRRERRSLVLWMIYSFSAPVLFYSAHLYPAVPIALFSVYLFRKIRPLQSLSVFNYLFLGFVLSLFIWFGLKYNMIFFPFLLFGTYWIFREQKARFKVFAFLIFPFLSLILFYIYVHALYGTYNPIAIYEGVLTPEKVQNFRQVILNIPLTLRIDTFFDYFLDQRDGLLLYSPLYAFAFLGLVGAFRKARKEFYILLFLFLPFILNYALLSHRQGHSPQGRVLAPVSWILILFVGYFLADNKKKIYTFFFRIACAVGFIFAFICLFSPSFLYQPTTHEYTFRGGDLFIFLSNLNFYLPDFLPSFIKVNNLGYWPNYAWLGLLMLFFIGYVKKGKKKGQLRYPSQILIVTSVALVLIVWFSIFPRLTLTWPVNVSYNTGEKISFYDLERHQQLRQQGKFLLSKDIHSYLFTFTSWRQLKNIDLEFGSPEGRYRLTIQLFDQMLFDGETDREIKTLSVSSPAAYRYKNTHLYCLRANLTNLSDISTSENPYVLTIKPSD